MAMDVLQEKIRKKKNPTLLELSFSMADVPASFSQDPSGYGDYCLALIDALKNVIPGVRVSFSAFALLGPDGLAELSRVLRHAASAGLYVVLDAPEIWSSAAAANAAQLLLGKGSAFPCNALVLSGYLGSDVITPFLPLCRQEKKELFVVARNGNRSAADIQDLLSGSRVVHMAVADHISRLGVDLVGKSGFSQVGILASATSTDSLRSLRAKYPRLFILVDGYDSPTPRAKNAGAAFDKYGHGAVVCSGLGIVCAWKEADDGAWETAALAEAERMRKNLTRYATIL